MIGRAYTLGWVSMLIVCFPVKGGRGGGWLVDAYPVVKGTALAILALATTGRRGSKSNLGK